MRGWMPLVVLMTGCMEYGIVDPNGDEPEGFTTGIDDGRSDDGTTTERENQEPNLDDDDEGSSSSCGGSSGSNGGSSSSGGSSCSSGANGSTPRAPQKGELVIHELMIDPSAVLDADGEWVELYNNTNDVLDLAYHRLADDNKDDSTIKSVYPGSLEVEPGDYLVICANEDYFDNGGADCHGTITYETWGGGFAMSNAGDEVILLSPNGAEIDSFSYGVNFAMAGVAMGLADDSISTTENDSEDNWCDQVSMMKSGDEGTPNRDNNLCF